MNRLFAIGGSPIVIDDLIENHLSFGAKDLLLESFDIKKVVNKNYEILYHFLDNEGNDDIWFDEIAPHVQELDLSWIAISINNLLDENEISSFEGDNGKDVTLLENFYVETTIVKGFD